MTVLGTFLEHVRDIVSDIEPQTQDPTSWFTHSDGLLPIEDDAGVSDRLFEVRIVDGGELGPMMDGQRIEQVTPFEIRVRYDGSDRTELFERIHEDALAIVSLLSERTSWGSADVMQVRATGRTREPDQQAHFEILILSFEARCLEHTL